MDSCCVEAKIGGVVRMILWNVWNHVVLSKNWYQKGGKMWPNVKNVLKPGKPKNTTATPVATRWTTHNHK
jgi:hypothetical protein